MTKLRSGSRWRRPCVGQRPCGVIKITGKEEEYQRAVEYLRGLGVSVDPIEMDTIE
jgi:hypothetical protein